MVPMFSSDNPTDEASHWLHFLIGSAKNAIDHQFGAGFAAKNPELVGAYIQAGATLMSVKDTAVAVDGLTGAMNEIGFALDRIDTSLSNLAKE
ncbi:MAG: hypothetical protein KJ911_11255 [Alphaproteobacteria bacterium]|jgi:hypothetical protein|uniref:Uncharacterized protein n=1 Tax=Brevundimonas mediterranea TaxID=74329 RepID=A0A7Z8Y5B2_9CAUL|nr:MULTISPECIES: hypothetical protein [Brevundimonas]MBU4197311.1 hypothetical protein [Alphaproteobacteria bacterium]MCG2662363.1 hypothetical protein [Brevundimonas sp.]VDC50969.1 hypothetical protein BREV_BREV_02398 [Brevundimonas mediterranea]